MYSNKILVQQWQDTSCLLQTPKSLLNPAAAALQPGSSSSTSRHSNGASTSGSGLLSIPAPGQGRVGNLILGAALVCAVAAVTARNFSSGPQLVPPRGCAYYCLRTKLYWLCCPHGQIEVSFPEHRLGTVCFSGCSNRQSHEQSHQFRDGH